MTRLPAEILPNHQVVRRGTAARTAQFARVFVAVSLIVSRLITAFICAPAHPSRSLVRARLVSPKIGNRLSHFAQGLDYTGPTDNDIECTMSRHQLPARVAKCVALQPAALMKSIKWQRRQRSAK